MKIDIRLIDLEIDTNYWVIELLGFNRGSLFFAQNNNGRITIELFFIILYQN